MKLIFLLLKLFYINRTAFAISEYIYIDKKNPQYNDNFYRIEQVIIIDIFFNYKNIDYMVRDMNGKEWGDTTQKVYSSKRKASKELLKLCKL